MDPAATDSAAGIVRSSLQSCLDELPVAHMVLAENGAIVHANVIARALLEVTNAGDLTGRTRGWFDTATMTDAAAMGFRSLDREYLRPSGQTIPLRVHLYAFATAELPAARFLVLIQALQPEAANTGGLAERQRELELAYARLQDAQEQLLQSDKMASIGQLAAGVAHEINNPIGYIHSNLGTLGEYIDNLFQLIEGYESALREVRTERPGRWGEIDALKQRIDYQFLVKDLPMLLSESREGIDRVRKIVEDLRDFSRAGYSEQWTLADLHRGLDSTLNIVWNDIKYKCDVVKNYSEIPQVECLPSQLNQVFLNILVNAGHAIEGRGTITIATGRDAENIFVDISDNGKGISEENLGRIFDPFFTTKPVGKGTGLGLSLSYSIVRKHGGRIDVHSRPGTGTSFRVVLPVRQPNTGENAPEHNPTGDQSVGYNPPGDASL